MDFQSYKQEYIANLKKLRAYFNGAKENNEVMISLINNSIKHIEWLGSQNNQLINNTILNKVNEQLTKQYTSALEMLSIQHTDKSTTQTQMCVIAMLNDKDAQDHFWNELNVQANTWVAKVRSFPSKEIYMPGYYTTFELPKDFQTILLNFRMVDHNGRYNDMELLQHINETLRGEPSGYTSEILRIFNTLTSKEKKLAKHYIPMLHFDYVYNAIHQGGKSCTRKSPKRKVNHNKHVLTKQTTTYKNKSYKIYIKDGERYIKTKNLTTNKFMYKKIK